MQLGGQNFILHLPSVGNKLLHVASWGNFTYKYIDYVLPKSNPKFENYLGQMHLVEAEIKCTIDSNTSAPSLDLLLSIGMYGQFITSIFDIHDDFNFNITNFPFLSSNILSSPTYGVSCYSLYDTPGLAPHMNVLF